MASKKSTETKPTNNPHFDFEANLAKLESLVTRMEAGNMSLEESLKAFEEGVKLTRLCQETLGSAQQKVQVLMKLQSAGQQNKISLKEMMFDNNNDENEDSDDDA